MRVSTRDFRTDDDKKRQEKLWKKNREKESSNKYQCELGKLELMI